MNRRELPPIEDLLTLEAAARLQSFTRAAEERGVTQGAISRQIRSLEDRLGVALFSRIKRRVVLTEAGSAYAAAVRRTLEDLSEAGYRAKSAGGAGSSLRLAVLPTFGTRWLAPRLADFARAAPEIQVQISVRVRPFDFDQDPFDAAIHHGEAAWPGAELYPLMEEALIAVASPELAARGRTAEGLLSLPLLHQTTRPSAWADYFQRRGLSARQAWTGARFEQFAMMTEAAATGLGAALLPRFLISPELASGKLVPLSPEIFPVGTAYYLAVPHARKDQPSVVAFRKWLLRAVHPA
ncbi:MAG: LysR substrate-binding domain-containing protein [Asticcacaulis sp.]